MDSLSDLCNQEYMTLLTNSQYGIYDEPPSPLESNSNEQQGYNIYETVCEDIDGSSKTQPPIAGAAQPLPPSAKSNSSRRMSETVYVGRTYPAGTRDQIPPPPHPDMVLKKIRVKKDSKRRRASRNSHPPPLDSQALYPAAAEERTNTPSRLRSPRHSAFTDPNVILPANAEKMQKLTERQNVALRDEDLLPLIGIDSYLDNCYHDPYKLVTDRSTDADDAGMFVKVGIQPNVLRFDDVIFTDVFESDVQVLPSKSVPVRPIQRFTRDACVSVFTFSNDDKTNRYIYLYDAETEQEIEFGMRTGGEIEAVMDVLTKIDAKTVQPLQMCHTIGVCQKLKLFTAITVESQHKGMVDWSTKPDEGLQYVTKAKKTKFLGAKYAKPLYASHVVTLCCLGQHSKVKTMNVRGIIYACGKARAMRHRGNYVVKNPRAPGSFNPNRKR